MKQKIKQRAIVPVLMGILILFITIIGMSLTGEPNIEEHSDAYIFKQEYEKLNNVEDEHGRYRDITIPDKNPMTYINLDTLNQKFVNGETFVVYFGFAKCPWCRSVVPTLINTANDVGIGTIYYIDIYSIRDTFEVNDAGEAVKTKDGSNDYNVLLTRLKDVLDDYIIKDKDGNEVNTGEKRIYAPTLVTVVNGKPIVKTTGISDAQVDSNQEITEDMKNDMYNKFAEVLTPAVNARRCDKDTLC